MLYFYMINTYFPSKSKSKGRPLPLSMITSFIIHIFSFVVWYPQSYILISSYQSLTYCHWQFQLWSPEICRILRQLMSKRLRNRCFYAPLCGDNFMIFANPWSFHECSKIHSEKYISNVKLWGHNTSLSACCLPSPPDKMEEFDQHVWAYGRLCCRVHWLDWFKTCN